MFRILVFELVKIKILHAIGSLSKGGAEFQCRQLASNLDPDRYDVSILCFDEGPNPDLAPHVRPLFVDRGSKWDLLALWKRIDALIEAEQPDIVQAWLPEVISVPAALAAPAASAALAVPVASAASAPFPPYLRTNLPPEPAVL